MSASYTASEERTRSTGGEPARRLRLGEGLRLLAALAAVAALAPAPAWAQGEAEPAPAAAETPAAEGGAEAGAEGDAGAAPTPEEAAAAAAATTAAITKESLTPEQRTLRANAFLEQALAAASTADWRTAARYAHEAWGMYPASEEKREAAELALADALVELGFEQAAAAHYFNVVQRRNMLQLLPRALAGVERLARRGLVLEEDLLRGVLAETELANLPPDLSDFLHYQRGIANLRLGNQRWTDYEFGRIRANGVYAQRARLTQAVAHVRDNEPAEALRMVEEMLLTDLDPDVRQEALLIQARLLFEAGRMEEAIAAFREVDQTRNVPAGEVLLERAWSHYRQDKLHDAMGLLYALGAPAHVDLFLPEAYVLRGLIYQRFCHFRAARRAAKEFRARYGEAIEEVEAGTSPFEIPMVAHATSILPHVAAVLRISDGAREEQERLDDQGGWIDEGGLRRHLDQLYEQVGARLEWIRARTVSAGANVIAERLLTAREQANLLEYEVGVSIHRRVNDAEGKVYRRPEAQVVPRTGDRTFYKFNGEYWSDELGDMRFLIENRCVE